MVAEETSMENAFETTLTAPMGPTDLAAAVVSIGSLTSPAILVIEPDDDAQREIIRFNGVFGAPSFVTQSVAFRYLPGSAAPSGLTHPSGAIVRSTPNTQVFEDLHDRIDTLDHGADLGGLGDDDHSQYHNNARGDARYVELTGDTMTGDLILNDAPTVALEATTMAYVDAADALRLLLTGGTMTGILTLDADPVAALEAATMQYVDTHLTEAEADALYLSLGGGTLTGDLATNEDSFRDDGAGGSWTASFVVHATLSLPAGKWLLHAGYNIETSTGSSRRYDGRIRNDTDAVTLREARNEGDDVIQTVMMATTLEIAGIRTIVLECEVSAVDGTQLIQAPYLIATPLYGTLTET